MNFSFNKHVKGGKLDFPFISKPLLWSLLWFVTTPWLHHAPFSCSKIRLSRSGLLKEILVMESWIKAMLSCAVWQKQESWCWEEPLNDSRILSFLIFLLSVMKMIHQIQITDAVRCYRPHPQQFWPCCCFILEINKTSETTSPSDVVCWSSPAGFPFPQFIAAASLCKWCLTVFPHHWFSLPPKLVAVVLEPLQASSSFTSQLELCISLSAPDIIAL